MWLQPVKTCLLVLLSFSHFATVVSYGHLGVASEDEEREAAKLQELRKQNFCAYILAKLEKPPAISVSDDDQAYLQELTAYSDGAKRWDDPRVYINSKGQAVEPNQDYVARNGFRSKDDFPFQLQKYSQFYDSGTGEFHYQPVRSRMLAVENGDEKIKAIRINYSDNRRARAEMLTSYENILAQMPGVQLWIVYRPRDLTELKARVDSMPRGIRKRIALVPIALAEHAQLFEWAHDSSIPVAAGHEGPKVLVPSFFGDSSKPRPDYRGSIDALQRDRLLKEVEDTPFKMSAGNVIAGARHVFVGSDILNEMIRHFQITRQEAIAALSAEFGKPVLEIGVPSRNGSMSQIAFDIDLTIAPARDHKSGKEIVLLESPRHVFEGILGLPRLETLGPESFRSEVSQKLSLWREKHPGPMTPQEKEFFDTLSQLPYEILMIRVKQTDLVRQRLEKNAYEVRSLPSMSLILTGSPGESLDVFGGYTNSILSGRQAIVPKIGIPMLDAPAAAEYTALGYQVIEDPSVQQLFLVSGGTRCASQVCRRGRQY